MENMSTLYKTLTMAMTAILIIASCGNATAKNDDKKKSAKETVKTVSAQELNATDFAEKVYDLSKDDLKYLGDKPAIVDFTAKWCGPCQRISPILDELAKEYEGKVVIYKVDIDKNPDLAQAFGVSSIPAILYIPLDGKPTMTIGARDKAKFHKEIETNLFGTK